ncbi:Serine carboxypeptidase 3 [Capsicum annuum]|nr:Serine carboxypeptidase 3 [Capsicum annuum]
MAFSFSFLFLALLVYLSPHALSLSSSNNDDEFSLSSTKFPVPMAEKFIEQLNLFPKRDINKALQGKSVTAAKQSLFEKRFNLSYLGDSGATVQDLGHHAGYYRLPHTKDARMFYFFFKSRRSQNDPVVIWLTGGPGCSSELAVFYENGMISAGTSYTSDDDDIRHDERGVSNDLYDFLQAFFKAHLQYVKNDFYITGESYAGHYIPAFASRVHQGNKNRDGIPINLKGFAIGNGLTNPEIQYKAYTDYALDMR